MITATPPPPPPQTSARVLTETHALVASCRDINSNSIFVANTSSSRETTHDLSGAAFVVHDIVVIPFPLTISYCLKDDFLPSNDSLPFSFTFYILATLRKRIALKKTSDPKRPGRTGRNVGKPGDFTTYAARHHSTLDTQQ